MDITWPEWFPTTDTLLYYGEWLMWTGLGFLAFALLRKITTTEEVEEVDD